MNKQIEFSEHLKKLRIENGFSQEELSEKSGLSLRTIQRLENAESSPRDDTLHLLTKAFNVPNDYFTETKDSYTVKKTKTRIPWFIISVTIIGFSLGLVLGISIVLSNKRLLNDSIAMLIITIAILFTGIGLLIGSILEKKFNKN